MNRSGSLAFLNVADWLRALARAEKNFHHTVKICMPFVAMLALGGCAGVQVKLGMKVDIAKLPVTSMQASLPQGPGIAPGEKTPLVVQFTQPDGKVLMTEGNAKGKVMWKDLTVTPTVVTAKKGVLRLARDPRMSDGKTGHVTVTVPSHPDLHSELDIPVRYDYPFAASFAGATGSNGMNGTDGTDGTSGSMGSFDPDNPSAGGDGSDGTNGTNGQNGDDGGAGPSVQVRVALKSETHALLQVSVTAQGRQDLFLVDTQGGSLTVKSLGGPGGSGGKGGRGGRGGSGGVGSPNGRDGMNGSDGQDGTSGSAGRGGSITVTYDPKVRQYLGLIKLDNPGGPAPVWSEETVGPIW